MKPLSIKIYVGLFALIYTMTVYGQANHSSPDTLDIKQQTLVAVAATAGKGDAQLLPALFGEALDAGWSVNELKEAMIHLYAYAGFPRSLNGLNMLKAVLEQRVKKGINDDLGRVPGPLPSITTKLEGGTILQARLLGNNTRTGTADFAPIIDVFLKEHLFWDIFSRDNLDFKTRELITISVIAGLGNAEPQLRAHIGVSMYNGITKAQLEQWAAVIQQKVGSKEGNMVRSVLQETITTDRTALKSGAGLQDDKVMDGAIFSTGKKISNQNFVGQVWLQQLVTSDGNNSIQVGNVTFKPGARTKWHLHPGGQILLAISGIGYYQEKGQAKKILRKGDVVKCPSNIAHWHGASADTSFVQVAITDTQKGSTLWLKPVTEKEYGAKF